MEHGVAAAAEIEARLNASHLNITIHCDNRLLHAATTPSLHLLNDANTSCLQAAKVARVLERVALSAIARFFVTTSRVSPSPLSAVSPVVVA